MFSITSLSRCSLVAAAMLASAALCAQSLPQTRVVNGSVVSVSDYPSIASLYYDSLEYNGIYYSGPYCGASILDPLHVLTAAHCVTGSASLPLFMVVVPQLQDEKQYPFGNIQRLRVSEIYYPDSFIDSAQVLFPDDIAVLKLATAMNIDAINDVIVRPSDESYRSAEQPFFTVGHGNTQTNDDSDTRLLAASLNYVANDLCAGTFSAGRYLTSKQICFDGNYSSVSQLKNSTCHGDSGGPVYWNNNGTLVQVGLTSFGPQTCGDPQWPVTSVFTEIHDYSTWIDRVLSGKETAKIVITEQMRVDYLNGDYVPEAANTTVGLEAVLASQRKGGALGIAVLVCLLLCGLRNATAWQRRFVQFFIVRDY